jgi:hypothetical protein
VREHKTAFTRQEINDQDLPWSEIEIDLPDGIKHVLWSISHAGAKQVLTRRN